MKNWIKGSLIFIIGLLVGSMITVLYISNCMNRMWLNSGDHHHILGRLCCELNLTADQKTKVEAILKSEDAEVNKLRDSNRKGFEKFREKIDAKIRPILTPEQIKKLDGLKQLREHPLAPPGFWASLWFLIHPMAPSVCPDSAPCSAK